MDLQAVRTFVAVADAGQFQEAAADLAITQQAVSKRVAALERDLGVTLFVRTARGARLTVDGQAFLPHARELLQAAARAADSVRPGRRALRVDVLNQQIAPAVLLRDFHRGHPGIDLDVVTLAAGDAAVAVDAVLAGTVDASFRAVTVPRRRLPAGIRTVPAVDDPLQLVVGPRHEFAGARTLTPARLAGHRIWMPSNTPGTEWAAFYDELAAAFGLTIDTIGPDFGTEALLDAVADSAGLATFAGERSRFVWPARHDLRRIALRDPTPVYPHSLVWRDDNPHPALAVLRRYVDTVRPAASSGSTWTPPAWAAGP